MRKILRASVLVLTLCAPALAGDIPMPPLPPQTNTVTQEPEAAGDTLKAQADSLTETVLSLIESVIALF